MAWKKQHKIGQFKEIDPEEQKAAEEERLAKEAADRERINGMKIGDRYAKYANSIHMHFCLHVMFGQMCVELLLNYQIFFLSFFILPKGAKFACQSNQQSVERLHTWVSLEVDAEFMF